MVRRLLPLLAPGPSWPVARTALVALVACALAALQPVRPLGAAAVAVLLLAVGRGLTGRWTAGLPRPAGTALALGTALAAAALAFQALADTRRFGVVGVVVVALVLVAAATWAGGRGAGAVRVSRRALLAVALAGAVAATLPAYAFDLGGRDAGFYVLAGEHLRATGTLQLEPDPDVAAGMARFGGDELGFDRDKVLPGFFLARSGATVPHGYHATPALLAAGATVTGGGGQWVITFAGIVLALLVAVAAALLAGGRLARVAAVAAGTLVATDAALLYFSRYPMTEVPSGVVLLTAGLAGWVAIARRAHAATVTAGAALGTLGLLRPDAWPLVAVAVLVAALLRHRGRRAVLLLAAGLALPLAYAAARASTITRAYTDESVGHVLGGVSGHALVAVIAAATLGLVLLVAAVPWPGAWPARVVRAASARRLPVALAALVGLAGLVVAVAPPAEGLEIFRTYATAPGLVLAALGAVALLLGRAGTPDGRWAALPLLLAAALALGLVAGDPQVLQPDQYWTARRFLPAALPVAAVLAGIAVAVAWHWPGDRRRPVVAATLLLALAAGAVGLRNAWPALSTTEFHGVPAQVEAVDAQITGSDPLVIMGPSERAWSALGPALALRQERHVLMIGAGRMAFQRDRAPLDDPALVRWLVDVASRRPVFLVLAGYGVVDVRTDFRRLAALLVGATPLRIREIEHRIGGPPRRSELHLTAVTVLRLQPVGRPVAP
ncbi:hypothetical protein SK069_00555 [Patulibacter brassicae]|uniref:Glycosyltransferase RgtA/B/C/D-like domain-containing protein n=1 Tax=Patulibacter brassicae TaxID=1705717 RepID=A0ABU4VE42_9ACTN|nr:hypothetical protein [Patulibacter brassicae]MDX8150068.1 hypothetical protein [Patulibacter brassicae]